MSASNNYVLPGLRVQAGNVLSVVHVGSKSGVLLSILYRIEVPDQDPKTEILKVPASSNRAGINTTIPLGTGTLTLLDIGAASAVNPQPLRGELYARAAIADTAKTISTTLVEGYVAGQQNLVWGPTGGLRESPWSGMGVLKTVSGAVPATGAEVADTVPTGARWRLVSAEVVLVTSGAAANRLVNFFVDDAGTPTRKLVLTDSTAQTATQTRTHGWYPGSDANSTASVSVTDTQTVLAKYPLALDGGLMLLAGDRLRTLTTAIDVNDAYGAARYTVEEWISTDT